MLIIIPCFNEYERLPIKDIESFLKQHKNIKIIFSDDASTDNTLKLLEKIRFDFNDQVSIYKLKINKGKAEAIRQAALHAFQKIDGFDKIAYLDADMAVSLEECVEHSKLLKKNKVLVFGSRISKIDNTIIRSDFRHYSGRFIATIISNLLEIKVYDTQCGCKIIDKSLAEKILNTPFISKWLFDVELFFRIIKLYSRADLKDICVEIPLKSWIDKGGSKVKITYFFKMWRDLYLIKKAYKDV